VSFEKAAPSGLTEAIEASISAEVKRDGNQPTAKLVLTVSTIGQGGSRSPLPDGPIAHTWFKVAKDAKPETVVKIEARATAQTTDTPPKPVAVTAPPVEFIVSEPNVISCFFYMH
jgi:hypothetical protein